MQLYIVRHGIAIDRKDPKSPAEAERYLTEEGIEKTGEVARGVVALGASADLLISSPYVRAMQTAEIFAEAFDYPKGKIEQTDSLLPEAESQAFFRELAKRKGYESVFCFGHGPQVDDMVATGVGGKGEFTALKKAGIALLELETLAPVKGQLVWLATPKMLRKKRK